MIKGKSIVALVCSLVLVGTSVATVLAKSTPDSAQSSIAAIKSNLSNTESQVKMEAKTPKYVFLFIGDGMSYPQIQITSDYITAMTQRNRDSHAKGAEILKAPTDLSFMQFPVAGSAVTYDSSSYCPDSASTATSISTGKKTYSGTINMDETKTVKYETIAEKLKKQLGYKVGIISSVNLNHATPAAFYSHQATRENYYEISKELVSSNFDYFAGGGLKKVNGSDGKQTSSYELAKKAGYKVAMTQAEAKMLNKYSGKVIVIDENLADSDAMAYENDRTEDMWALADYVDKGIEVLDNSNGFFMMVEGGKIDWACHANDADSTINDTLAFDNAVKEAVEFYNKHPDETLIIVTADHETGGLTLGFSGTNYDTYFDNLANQKISYAKFDSDYVANYKKNKTSFENVLMDIKTNFGLITSKDADAKKAENSRLTLSDYEYNKLKTAYDKTMSGSKDLSQEEYELYGSYEPLTVTITHILNNKSGVSFTSYSHTGLPVPVMAQGAKAENFNGYYDNTDIYNKLASIMNVK